MAPGSCRWMSTGRRAFGEAEEGVEGCHRVAVDRAGVEAADDVGALRQRAIEQLRRPGPTQHARLREGDDLDLLQCRASPRACAARLRDGRGRPWVSTSTWVRSRVVPARGRPAPSPATGRRRRARWRARKSRSLSILSMSGCRPCCGTRPCPHGLVEVGVAFDEAGQQQGPAAVFHAAAGRRRKAGRGPRSARPGPARPGLQRPRGAHCGSEVSHAWQLGWNESCACLWACQVSRDGSISRSMDSIMSNQYASILPRLPAALAGSVSAPALRRRAPMWARRTSGRIFR